MATFDDALAGLSTAHRGYVEECLRGWASDEKWRQIADNIRAECALTAGHFESLLLDFAQRLADAMEGHAAWENACKRHELRGAELPSSARPRILGRASSLGTMARSMSRANPDIDDDIAARDIRRYSGIEPPGHVRAHLRAMTLGRSPIWATFDAEDTGRDPFLSLPPTASAIRCALGLGHVTEGEPLVALVYHTAAPEHGRPIHRPTVADASSHSFYRPHADAGAVCGYTGPLAPNPQALPPMPEVVHPEVTGTALLGYRLLP